MFSPGDPRMELAGKGRFKTCMTTQELPLKLGKCIRTRKIV